MKFKEYLKVEDTMKFKEYLKVQFPIDLRRLRRRRSDNNTIYFFGGRDWENIERDIAHIEKNNLEYFFLCLFTITVIDLTMHSYFRDEYSVFRSKTMYPKFGWSGFCRHFENPKKLLQIPYSMKLVDYSTIINIIDEYIDLFIEECNAFFSNILPDIKTDDFISKLIADEDFKMKNEDNNTIFEKIYCKLKERVE